MVEYRPIHIDRSMRDALAEMEAQLRGESRRIYADTLRLLIDGYDRAEPVHQPDPEGAAEAERQALGDG